MLLAVGLVWATETEWPETGVITAPEGWNPAPYTPVDRVSGVAGVQVEVHLTQVDTSGFRLWADGRDNRGAPARIPLAVGVGEANFLSDTCGRISVWTTAATEAQVYALAPTLDGLVAYSSRTDTDGDGVSDAHEEVFYCSDPTDPDTDGDGLDDFEDVNNGCSAVLTDSDAGGVGDFEEVHLDGTACTLTNDDDPTQRSGDLDGDGLSNEEEYTFGTSLLAADWDGDGLLDGEELAWGTDPLDYDTDGGGTADGEARWGADPLDPGDDEGLAYAQAGDAVLIWECEMPPMPVDWIPDGLNPDELAAYEAEVAAQEAEIAAWEATCADAEARHSRDSDGDGLTDYLEVFVWYTDPLVADTDGDGLTDAEEVDGTGNRTDPNAVDGDGDGLTDVEEWALHTPGWSADADWDGLTDLDELAAGTDPARWDTDQGRAPDGEVLVGGDPLDPSDDAAFYDNPDGDKVPAYFELLHGCDPADADTDDDGLSDSLEISFSTGCTDPDSDGDGWSDGEEVRAKTLPYNAADHP